MRATLALNGLTIALVNVKKFAENYLFLNILYLQQNFQNLLRKTKLQNVNSKCAMKSLAKFTTGRPLLCSSYLVMLQVLSSYANNYLPVLY